MIFKSMKFQSITFVWSVINKIAVQTWTINSLHVADLINKYLKHSLVRIPLRNGSSAYFVSCEKYV